MERKKQFAKLRRRIGEVEKALNPLNIIEEVDDLRRASLERSAARLHQLADDIENFLSQRVDE